MDSRSKQYESGGKAQDHPAVQRVEDWAVGIRACVYGKFVERDLWHIDQPVQIVGDRQQGKQALGDQKQRFIPASRPVPPEDAQAGNQEERGDHRHGHKIQVNRIPQRDDFLRKAVLEDPQQKIEKHHQRRADQPGPLPRGQEPGPHGLDPEQQQADVDQVAALAHQRIERQDPGVGQRVGDAGQQKKDDEKAGITLRIWIVHGNSPFPGDIQATVGMSPGACGFIRKTQTRFPGFLSIAFLNQIVYTTKQQDCLHFRA